MPLTIAAVLVASIGAQSDTLAQTPGERPTRIWMAIGLGGGGAHELETDAGVAFQLTVQRGGHQVGLRALSMGDWGSFPDGSDDTIDELGLVYGRWVAWSFGYAAMSAGLAHVSARGLPQEDGGGLSPSDGRTRRTVGVPLVLESGLQSTVIGAGLQLFANLNSVSSYAGAAVSLYLGWMP